METLILKTAVAVIPFVLIVASIIWSLSHTRHTLSWHRRRRSIERTLAGGIMMH